MNPRSIRDALLVAALVVNATRFGYEFATPEIDIYVAWTLIVFVLCAFALACSPRDHE